MILKSVVSVLANLVHTYLLVKPASNHRLLAKLVRTYLLAKLEHTHLLAKLVHTHLLANSKPNAMFRTKLKIGIYKQIFMKSFYKTRILILKSLVSEVSNSKHGVIFETDRNIRKFIRQQI